MFSTFVAISIVLIQVALVATLIGMFVKAPFVAHIARLSPVFLALIFIGGTVASFVYQYGFGYEPCLLCWYQRIFIIPIAILSLTADIRSSQLLQRQVLILAVLGLAIALFHNYIDMFPTGLDVCGATGPSCLARYVYEFGYITIPMMSATTLLAGIVLVVLARRYPHASLVNVVK